jgi:hypothetical protein
MITLRRLSFFCQHEFQVHFQEIHPPAMAANEQGGTAVDDNASSEAARFYGERT